MYINLFSLVHIEYPYRLLDCNRMKFIKRSLCALAFAIGSIALASASSESVSCGAVDYLYYSNECCDTSNTVSCLKSIPQASKEAVDQLANLKRANGDPCVDGDSVKYLADADGQLAGAQPGLACVQ